MLEEVTADPETVDGLRRLKGLHYRIALDDFVYADGLVPMILLSDYLKLDLLALGADGLDEQMALLARFDVRIVAEKSNRRPSSAGAARLAANFSRDTTFAALRSWPAGAFPSNRLSLLSLLPACADMESSAVVIAGLIARDAPSPTA